MTCAALFTSLAAMGLAQVGAWFKHPMTLRLGLRSSASLLDFANVIHGLRIMGDSASGNHHSGD